MAFESAYFLDSPTGATLAVRKQPPATVPRGIILICHGLAEHSGRYKPFADILSNQGFWVFALDHRGHGLTKAPDAPLGQFARTDGVAKVIADVMALYAHAVATAPDLPVILFGHSMGGMIAANVAEAHPRAFSGLAIWNSNLNPGLLGRIGRVLFKAERFFKGSDVPSMLGPKLTFDAWAKTVPDRRTEFDWLSRDPAIVDAYIADPLCGFDCSVSLWIDVLTMAMNGGADANLAKLPKALPVHLTGGSQDPATEKATAMTWLKEQMDRIGIINVNLVIHEGMRHETLNEIGGMQAAEDFANWCVRVAGLFR